MKISTKGRYALRFLVDLAEYGEGGYVSLKDAADRQDISKKYLEQIVPSLTKAEIILANRGQQGGYRLAKKPAEILVGDVLRLTEGDLAPVACLKKNSSSDCTRSIDCPTLPVWKGLYKVINDYLDSITLEDLIHEVV